MHSLCSGRAPLKLTLEHLKCEGYSPSNPLPVRHAHNITVPGAAAGWADTVERFGSGKVRTMLPSQHQYSTLSPLALQTGL